MPSTQPYARFGARVVRNSATLTAPVLLFAVAMALLAGCAAGSPPSEAPSITGTVTQASWNDEGIGTMLVEGPTQPAGAVSDKASVTVTEDTTFYAADGSRLDDRPRLSVGAEVRVWFTGPVAESYPVQATAKAVQYVD